MNIQPPSPPLVGVELNPGPCDHLIMLYDDVLRTILSFVSPLDLLIAVTSCCKRFLELIINMKSFQQTGKLICKTDDINDGVSLINSPTMHHCNKINLLYLVKLY